MFSKQYVLNILHCNANRVVTILDGNYDALRCTDIVCIYLK